MNSRNNGPVVQVSNSVRKWNEVEESSRVGNCCLCRVPTKNSISVLIYADSRRMYFCGDRCVDKFKEAVRKW